MSDITCPACGSNDLDEIKSIRVISESFGGQKQIELTEYLCNSCDCSGDFASQNEQQIKESITELKHEAVLKILDDFSNSEVTFSAIERALELPQRTLTKWKNKVSMPSSSGIALLKFLRLFPWLLEVAENKCNYDISQQIHLNDAFQTFIQNMNFGENNLTQTGMISSEDESLFWCSIKNSESENQMIPPEETQSVPVISYT